MLSDDFIERHDSAYDTVTNKLDAIFLSCRARVGMQLSQMAHGRVNGYVC